MTRAWNAGDGAAWAAHFAEDADFVAVVGRILLVHTVSTLRVPEGPRAGEWHAIQTKIVRDGKILAFHNTGRMDLADFVGDDEGLARRSPQEWRRQDS
ncbi:hypothetical protein ACEYXF_18230 [Streptomyces asiaticus]|uniref:hypothetical protein n=1 Tax=Streptomyces asiaticus TaxID=114695 RepID=UPI0039BDB00F